MRDHVTMLKTMTDKAGVNNLMTNVLTAMSKEQKAAMDEQVRVWRRACAGVDVWGRRGGGVGARKVGCLCALRSECA